MGHNSRMQFSNPLFSLMTRTVELRLFIVGSLTLLRYLTLEVSTLFLVRLLDKLNRYKKIWRLLQMMVLDIYAALSFFFVLVDSRFLCNFKVYFLLLDDSKAE